MRALLPLLLTVGLQAGCQARPNRPIEVFAAASTRDALGEIAEHFQTETGEAVRLTFGASSTLSRQIEQGATADLFLSADEVCADELKKHDLVKDQVDLLTNELVIVVPADSSVEIKTVADLASPAIKRLALAGAEVPVGRYARQALRAAQTWDGVEGRVLNGGDVKATLNYVAMGEADAGVVYRTDPVGNGKVRVACEVPAGLHEPIRYPLVTVRQDHSAPGRDRFAAYLTSEPARAIFRRERFGILP
jgi:molybdate transport system substrate-binding protein